MLLKSLTLGAKSTQEELRKGTLIATCDVVNNSLVDLNVQMAERYYVQAGMTKEAIDMYTAAGKWEAAHKVND